MVMLCNPNCFSTYTYRKAPFKLAGGIEFREIWAMSCTQMSSDCARTVRDFLNGVSGKLLPGALQKWHLAQSSLTYTPPQKKGSFIKVVYSSILAKVPNIFRILSRVSKPVQNGFSSRFRHSLRLYPLGKSAFNLKCQASDYLYISLIYIVKILSDYFLWLVSLLSTI